MDVIDIARIVLRRWWVTLPVLLIAVGIAMLVVARAEPEYELSGSFLLTDAALVTSPRGPDRSPADRPLAVTPGIIAELVRSDDTRGRVIEAGGTPDYEVHMTGDPNLLRVEAAADEEGAAISTVQLVLDEIDEVLTERQQAGGIPDGRRMTTEILSSPSSARREATELGEGEEAVRYVATGSVRLIGPAEMGANPYAASLGGTLRVLQERVTSPVVRQEIAQNGGTGVYEMGQRDNAVPILQVIGRGRSPEEAITTFQLAVVRLEQELQDRQEAAGASPSTWLAFDPLALPAQPALVGGQLRRPLIVIVGLGIVAAISMALLVEGLATRRRTGKWRPPISSVDELASANGESEQSIAEERVHWR